MTFGFLQIILGLVALGAMVGIYFINKKQSPQGQSMSLLLLAVFIIAGGAFLWTSNILSVIGIGQTRQEKMREDGQQFYASHPDVIIIAAGLPAGSPAGIRCIKKNNKTPVYLSYKSGIRRDMAEQLVGEGYVAGAIVRTNKSQRDAVASADLQESFDQMYSYIGE